MAEEVGIVMSLYDRVSPTLKSITGNAKAFDKSLDELEQSIKDYDKNQDIMVKKSADLKKALAEADQQVKNAQKSYKKLNDEASKKTLAEAIDRQTQLRQALADTEVNLKANTKAYADLYEKARKAARGMDETAAAASRAENRAGSGTTGLGELTKGLVTAGIGQMFGDAFSNIGNAWLSSAIGEPQARVASSILSGAVSGGTMGAVAGPIGIALGAAAGGLAGLVSGGSEVYAAGDDAFKSYVQEATQGQMSAMTDAITSGSGIAAQRELDTIAFDQLLGEGQGKAYLSRLRTMAASTPMEYSDLTSMSRALATGFGTDQDRMLALIEDIGNAGSAVGVDAAGMATMAQALSRMQSSGKANLEYLNMFQDRGIDVIGMLATALGTDQGSIYDRLSEGSLSGTQAVDIIQEGLSRYAGAMDEMSQTYSGLTSTLADAQAEMDNAYGEGYNETRKQGMQEEINWLSGESGALLQEANRAMGAWQAELENTEEQYMREALSAVMTGSKALSLSEEAQARLNEMRTAYQEAEGDAAEQGRLLAQAKVLAQGEYNASEGAQLMVEYEIAMAEGIRDDAASNSAYWDAGYRKGQEYSKGLIAGMAGNKETAVPSSSSSTKPTSAASNNAAPPVQSIVPSYAAISGAAYGISRVPYDNFPVLLHEGERVLTAREAREADRGDSPIQITITGNTFGAGVSAEEMAQKLADALEVKLAAGRVSA